MTAEQKDRILEAVEAEFPELLNVAQAAVRINSINPNHEGGEAPEARGGESRVSRLLASYMERAGMEVDLFAIAEGRENAVGQVGGAEKGNLSGCSLGALPARSLLFNGHVDVVGPGDLTTWKVSDPWSGDIKDGRLYGRGSTDMKAGLVCTIAAVKALHNLGLKPEGRVIIEAVCGEESGEKEYGTQACIDRGYRADAGIVVEASAPPYPLALEPAGPGVMAFEIWVEGKSGHTCMYDEIVRAGGHGDAWAVSALDKIVFVYEGMKRLNERWGITKTHPVFTRPGHFTLGPMGIWSGPTTYAINASACLTYTAWIPPQEKPEEIQKEIIDYVGKWCSSDPWLESHPPVFKWLDIWPGFEVPTDSQLCQALGHAYEEALNSSVPTSGFTGVSDASFLNAAGIPTVVMGPGNIRFAHGPDEFVDTKELLDAAKVYALMIASFCGLTG